MCDCFKDLTKPSEEITLKDIKKLLEMAFTIIMGEGLFVRQDIPEIVRELYKEMRLNFYLYQRIFYRQDLSAVQNTSEMVRGVL